MIGGSKCRDTNIENPFNNRQIVLLSDGGHLALDWAQSHDEDSSTKPIFLIVPGLTGTYNDIP